MIAHRHATVLPALLLLGAAGLPIAGGRLQAGERLARLFAPRDQEVRLHGRTTGPDGRALAGVFVTARPAGRTMAISVRSDAAGDWTIPGLPPGGVGLRAHAPGFAPAEASLEPTAGSARHDFRLEPRDRAPADRPSADFLAVLPDGEEKRRFILDCTGCHLFDERIALPAGTPRPGPDWAEAVGRMLRFAGATSGFPVIGAARDPASTAEYLIRHFNPRAGVPAGLRETAGGGGAGGASGSPVPAAGTVPAPSNIRSDIVTITEYDLPVETDLPHDVAVMGDGRVLVTGMFTHRMYVLEPETGGLETVAIPVANANPRAVEVDGRGDWWVVLGSPRSVARYRPGAGEWDVWEVSMYAHSLGLGADGRVWFNGHFTRDPELLGWVDAVRDTVETRRVPTHPGAAETGPIPYELRVGPDGRVWVSELAGNRVVAYDPGRETFRVYGMPEAHSGPRRLDVAPDGAVWIPEYAGNRLTRLDPATGRFEGFDLPVRDAAPYVARVDGRGTVWVGTAAADAVLAFDPGVRRFTVHPLPTRGAMVRHIAIDGRNGDVWLAYGASPGGRARVARLRVEG